MEKFGFSCCFCNQNIIENKTDPIDINIITHENMINNPRCNQSFFSHFDCFKQKLHPHLRGYFIRDDDLCLHYEDKDSITKNKDYLIKKIMELENVDHWKIIYYGLITNHSNTQFVMDYCYALIENTNCLDQFVLDIAALITKEDLSNLPKMIAKKINNPEEIIIDSEQYYSKIWSYLVLAADMCSQNIIK